MANVSLQISEVQDTFKRYYKMQPWLRAKIPRGSITNNLISCQSCQGSQIRGLHATEI